jgi:flagellar motor switch/type III secretory pathway protein FliN
VEGRFAVVLDGKILETPLVGEGVDQKAGWAELLREVADAAAGELLAKTGKKCRSRSSRRSRGEQGLARLPVEVGRSRLDDSGAGRGARPKPSCRSRRPSAGGDARAGPANARGRVTASGLSPGLELLLDVELEASLRFGCREMPLGEILDLGPGTWCSWTVMWPTRWT